MNTKTVRNLFSFSRTLLVALPALAALALATSGCSPVTAIGRAAGISRASAPDGDPAAVAEGFYAWYLGDARQEGNALVSGAYAERPELTAALVGRVEEELAAMQMGGGDPFLCAQDVPAEMRFEKPRTAADGARSTIVAHGVWNAGTAYEVTNVLTLHLVETDQGAWRIDEIACR